MHGWSVPTVLAIPGVIDTECFIYAGVKDTNIRPMSCSVPVVQLDSLEEFHSTVYPTRRPTILRGVSLGPAPSLWTPSYLAEKCGSLPVKIHVSPVPQMDFINKNFVYRQV